ncbi:oxidative stress response protein Oxr1 [Aspergillus bombycis]|uniref:Oxidation resistance protein 1 n=1 Tax=Aspergillus bombycis TaxID=109264 RepID=A0A1F7ZWN2_9EURO|nr:oxidative stress response protein Oxr1 [Aspergillus bombycis]OGM43892.1 oxidative stress response protein Oxr1 [Aspergillus bombycis]
MSSSASSSRSASRSRQSNNAQIHQSTASYFSYPVTHVVSGLYRRLTDPPASKSKTSMNRNRSSMTTPNDSITSSQVFTPVRTASPFQPPPLTPLTLTGDPSNLQQQLLTRALAEEIRLLVPARLQLVDTWRLAYSLDRDAPRSPPSMKIVEKCLTVARGRATSSSSATLLPPAPYSHYYGTGECFLWRASVLAPPTNLSLSRDGPPSEDMLELAGLPLPPSADTTHAGRSTTLRASDAKLAPPPASGRTSGASTPERIRFKAFPYSGVNDYMMFCETGFLSLGGGDGHYGLWVDSSLEKGVSAGCQTFGNEPLSDEGVKFDILGVEVWYVGA